MADGGPEKLLARLQDPGARARVKKDLASDHLDWENLFHDVGGAPGVLLASVESPDLEKFEGKRLSDVAAEWKKSPEDTLMDFILQDRGQTGAIYFMASEEDLKTGLKQSWTSIGLDANAMALDGPTFEPHTHPRAFGSMARFLGRYVRDERLMPLEEAVRKITSLPAQRQRLTERGLLRAGYYADVTVFDPSSILDHATFEKPNALSTGVDAVLVNGQVEYERGRPTGVTAGRVLRGRGFQPAPVSK
jgi:N-acyl-D-aspartate/D-glutamate deacylase